MEGPGQKASFPHANAKTGRSGGGEWEAQSIGHCHVPLYVFFPSLIFMGFIHAGKGAYPICESG